jgi:hypothetical protein
MLSLLSVWLPILLSTVAIFLASSLIWMVLPWHQKEWRGVADQEEAARNALRGLAPGLYHLPHPASRAALRSPEFQRKMTEGPMAFLTVVPNGMPNMARQMISWVAVIVFLMIVVAYIATRTLGPGTEYLEVFRIVGTTGWLAFGAATLQEAVWFGRPWRSVLTMNLDALIYALLAAGIFASMWPQA